MKDLIKGASEYFEKGPPKFLYLYNSVMPDRELIDNTAVTFHEGLAPLQVR